MQNSISKKEYSEITYFKNGYSQIKIRKEDSNFINLNVPCLIIQKIRLIDTS